MKKDFERKYHDSETYHWWFRSRRNCIKNWLRNAPRESRILDIGCSSGILLNELKQMGFHDYNLYGIDISQNAIDNAKASGIQNVQVMDAQEISLPVDFDYIIASDCLEHLKDDGKALRNWYNLLKPGGTAFIFVPAFMGLWSHHDVVNMHFRRYTRGELTSKIAQTGFRIFSSGYWNFLLFLPVFAYRRVSSLFSKTGSESGDIKTPPAAVNRILTSMINLENVMMKMFRFPFGVSTFCIARKP